MYMVSFLISNNTLSLVPVVCTLYVNMIDLFMEGVSEDSTSRGGKRSIGPVAGRKTFSSESAGG